MTGKRLDLNGTVVVITGGAAGIGEQTARSMAARGAKVAVLDRDGVAANTLASTSPVALGLEADVTNPAAIEAAMDEVRRTLGPIDVVVANAGITPPPGTLATTDPEHFRRVIDVNLHGVLNTVRAALPDVIARRGHVVVVASCAAFSPPLGGSAYMVSKAAVEVLARAFRLELSTHGVTVSTIAFGIVETGMTHATLDEDPIGQRAGSMLPWPLNRRISAQAAAQAITTAVERRAVRVTRPRSWAVLGHARGMLVRPMDAVLTRLPATHELVRLLEDRASNPGRDQ